MQPVILATTVVLLTVPSPCLARDAGENSEPGHGPLRAGSSHQAESGETVASDVPLEEGDLLHAKIQQLGADVSLRILDPDGATVWESDDRAVGVGFEEAWHVAGRAGVHRLEVLNEGLEDGAFEVIAFAVGPATREERLRAAAERDLSTVRRLLRNDDPEATEKAGLLTERAIGVLRELDLPRRLGSAWALDAFVLRRLGRPDQAEESFLKALSLAEESGDLTAAAAVTNSRAIARWRAGDPPGATELARRAVELAREAEDPAAPLRLAESLNTLGLVLDQQGETREAEIAYEEAARVFGEIRARSGAARTLNNLGTLRLMRGDADGAIDAFTASLEDVRALGERLAEGVIVMNIGEVFRRLGDAARAVDYFERARLVFEEVEDDAWLADSWINLGTAYDDLERPEEARQAWKRARDLHAALGNEAKVGLVAFNLGDLAYRMGDLETARSDLESALVPLRESGMLRNVASALSTLGALATDEGSLDGARSHLDEALAISRAALDSEEKALVLYRLALLERSAERPRKAQQRAEEAVAVVESVRTRIASTDLRATYLDKMRPFYELPLELLWVKQETRGSSTVDSAFAISERARARALVDLIGLAREEIGSTAPPDLRRREEELENEIAHLQAAILETRDSGDDPSKLEEELSWTLEAWDLLVQEVRRRDPRYASLVHPRPSSLAEVQARLGPEQALVEYFVGSESTYLFAVTRDRAEWFSLPGSGELESRIDRLGQALQEPSRRGLRSFAGAARSLYRDLLEPAGELLAGKRELVVVADGPLHRIPFAALLTEDVSDVSRPDILPYLVRRWVVRSAPSATVLAHLEGVRRPELELAAVAGTFETDRLALSGSDGDQPLRGVLGDTSRQDLGPLPGAEREIREVAALFPSDAVRMFTGTDAREEVVKASGSLERARFVHFATHGLVSETRPLESGLLLTPSPDGSEDGFLQVREIFQLRLAADLVALSACRSGLGRPVAGEGMMGFSHAFFHAGARSLLLTLWSVSDRATPDLIRGLYEGIREGMDTADALRASQLERIREKTFSHPHYWAPFVLIGDGERTATSEPSARRAESGGPESGETNSGP